VGNLGVGAVPYKCFQWVSCRTTWTKGEEEEEEKKERGGEEEGGS